MINWQTATSSLALKPDHIHIWRAQLSKHTAHITTFENTLSQQEQQQQMSFKFSYLQQRYAVCRGILRDILSRYLSCTAASIVFRYQQQGKPDIASPNTELQFNVSHSDDYALFAITKNTIVGVDIEAINAKTFTQQLAEQVFSKQELKALQTFNGKEKIYAFYKAWTRKEAFIKAIALGLNFPLDKFSVALDEKQENCLLAINDEQYLINDWFITAIDFNTEYCAAVATQSSMQEIDYWQYEKS